MKLGRIFIIIASLLTLVVTAQARLGDTPEEAEKRFGKPTAVEMAISSPEEKTFKYTSSGVKIVITFWNGVSHHESYSKDFISPNEVDVLLKANSGKGSDVDTFSVWHYDSEKSLRDLPEGADWEEFWFTDDGRKAVHRHTVGGSGRPEFLVFTTKEYGEKDAKKKKKEISPALKDALDEAAKREKEVKENLKKF